MPLVLGHVCGLQELLAELLKGSLATYINALTYPDKTVYPIASTNLQASRRGSCRELSRSPKLPLFE